MRNVFDAFHQPDEQFVLVGPAGGEADAAVAHHDGGDTVRRRRHDTAFPCHLAVVVGVDVDETRRDHQPAGVDGVAGAAVRPANGGDAPAGNRHVGLEGGAAGAVHHQTPLDEQIESKRHG